MEVPLCGYTFGITNQQYLGLLTVQPGLSTEGLMIRILQVPMFILRVINQFTYGMAMEKTIRG